MTTVISAVLLQFFFLILFNLWLHTLKQIFHCKTMISIPQSHSSILIFINHLLRLLYYFSDEKLKFNIHVKRAREKKFTENRLTDKIQSRF